MRNRVIIIALLLFALYFVAVYPVEAAQLVRQTFNGAIDLATGVARSMSEFMRELV